MRLSIHVHVEPTNAGIFYLYIIMQTIHRSIIAILLSVLDYFSLITIDGSICQVLTYRMRVSVSYCAGKYAIFGGYWIAS